MQSDQGVNNLQISSDIIGHLLDDFERSINSIRLQSQITTIGELICVLWKRNLFGGDATATQNQILKHIACNTQRDTIRAYITSLAANENANGSQNAYGNCDFDV